MFGAASGVPTLLPHLKLQLVPETVDLVIDLQDCLDVRAACFQVSINYCSCHEEGKAAFLRAAVGAALLSLDLLPEFAQLGGLLFSVYTQLFVFLLLWA